MEQQYRATVFIKFSMKPEKMKELGFDIEMPPSGFLYDDLLQLIDGSEGVTVVESAVVKECTPLPRPLEVIQTICEACNLLKPTSQTHNGRVCSDCNGSVVPIRPREVHGPTIQK
mgnify:CR=1 FL=1